MIHHTQQTQHRRHTQPSRTILVIGASGTTGRRVSDRLTTAGHDVRNASRSSDTHFDWNDQTTWTPALDGASAASITSSPDLAFPGAADTVGEFVDLAVKHGVRRLVLLSGRGEDGARAAEQRPENSGAEWTIVRCEFFAQNFDEAFTDTVRAGYLTAPAGDTLEPFVDADDIADVVVAAFTDRRHIGMLDELTGPRLLTYADVAAELSSATGRHIDDISVTVEDFAADLVDAGFTLDEANPIAELFADVLDGRNAHLTDGVQRALGRPPRDFAEYATTTAATGIWDQVKVS